MMFGEIMDKLAKLNIDCKASENDYGKHTKTYATVNERHSLTMTHIIVYCLEISLIKWRNII